MQAIDRSHAPARPRQEGHSRRDSQRCVAPGGGARSPAGPLPAARLARAPVGRRPRAHPAEDGERQHRHEGGDRRGAGQGRVQQHHRHVLPARRAEAEGPATGAGAHVEQGPTAAAASAASTRRSSVIVAAGGT